MLPKQVQIEVRMQVEEGIQGLDQKLGSIIKKLVSNHFRLAWASTDR